MERSRRTGEGPDLGRRRFLAGVAAAATGALAGCLAGRDPATQPGDVQETPTGDDGKETSTGDDGKETPTGDDGQETTSGHEMGERVEVGGGAVRVSNPRVRRTFVYDNSVWKSVKGEAGTQYLLVDVETSGFDRPRTSWFDVVLAGEQLDVEAHATTGDAGVANGVVALPVPIREAESGAVRWDRGGEVSWSLPSSVVERFATAPRFEVLGASYSHAAGLTLEVANRGDRDGVFALRVAPSNASDISAILTATVAAGKTRTLRYGTAELQVVTPTPGIELELSWGTGGTDVPIGTPGPTPEG